MITASSGRPGGEGGTGAGRPRFHAAIVPSSVAKMKSAGQFGVVGHRVFGVFGMRNAGVRLATWPVGAPVAPPSVGSVGEGISTTSGVAGDGKGFPVPSYR